MNTLSTLQEDPWLNLKSWTDARIALGRAGTSVPVKPLLDFQLAHAQARDAVQTTCDFSETAATIQALGLPLLQVHSQALTRDEYLRRPDLGRLLDKESEQVIKETAEKLSSFDICLVVADGLSSQAVENQATQTIKALIPKILDSGLTLAPVVLAQQSRVALADEVGFLLKASLTIILIGERPGLSSPDSLGAYLTWGPKRGLQNADRNCLSNIRPAGMSYEEAAKTLMHLIQGAFAFQVSGIKLKEDTYLQAPQKVRELV